MRRIDQAELLEVRHHVADRGRRQRHRNQPRDVARTDRFAGREIALDDLPKNLARALIELGEPRMRRDQADRIVAGPNAPRKHCQLPLKQECSRFRRARQAGFTSQRSKSPCRCGAAAPKSTARSSFMISGGFPMRPSRRAPDELRAVSLERGVVKYAEGSCLVKFGDTHVLVTATLEERLPPWLQGPGPRLGHRRIRHAAARHPGADPPRGVGRQAERPHRRDPAPDRPLAARRGRPRRARRTPDHGRLRRACRPTAAPAPPRSPAPGSRSPTASPG